MTWRMAPEPTPSKVKGTRFLAAFLEAKPQSGFPSSLCRNSYYFLASIPHPPEPRFSQGGLRMGTSMYPYAVGVKQLHRKSQGSLVKFYLQPLEQKPGGF